MRYVLITFVLLFTSIEMAYSADRLKEASFPTQLSDRPPALERKAQGVLTSIWADIYAAALFTDPSICPQHPFTEQWAQRLEPYYFRNIDKSDAIKVTNTTLAHQQNKATLAQLRQELDPSHGSIQDIQRGDRYRPSYQPHQGMSPERNGQVIFSSANPQLAKVYFSLWLVLHGLSNSLRQTLLDRG